MQDGKMRKNRIGLSGTREVREREFPIDCSL
jgi:hypothetical protein